MVLHELVINALKHGALSIDEGRVSATWRIDDQDLHLIWQERGGPTASAPTRRGFGTRLIDANVRVQLGGMVEWRWEPQGLSCELVIPLARVARPEPA